MDRRALIDGDVLVYNAGFASDAVARDTGAEHEPLAHALHGVNQKIDAVMRAAQCHEHTIFLSHPVNYREGLFPDYKRNRDTKHKPYWYNEIKQHLLDRYGAVFSAQGDEADDALGLAQMRALSEGETTVICTIDKDLDMIPGWHYNFGPKRKEDGLYWMEDPEGLRLFYKQLITGDTSDNIPGLYRRKGRKAEKRLLARLDDLTDERDMYQYVLALFGTDEADFLSMTGKLLWIKRDERWWEAPL